MIKKLLGDNPIAVLDLLVVNGKHVSNYPSSAAQGLVSMPKLVGLGNVSRGVS